MPPVADDSAPAAAIGSPADAAAASTGSSLDHASRIQAALARMLHVELVALLNVSRHSPRMAPELRSWIDRLVLWELDHRNQSGSPMPPIDAIAEDCREACLQDLDNVADLFQRTGRSSSSALATFLEELRRVLSASARPTQGQGES